MTVLRSEGSEESGNEKNRDARRNWMGFFSPNSYNLNESSSVDAVVLLYSCFLFHSERICDACKIVHSCKCVWVTLPKPEEEFSSRTEGKGEGNGEQKV